MDNENQNKNNGDILIVDDNLANLQTLEILLTSEGYSVRCAPSGKVALMIVNTMPPDLIFLDVRMPEMDGFEVCRKLKENPATSEIPVIFISASNSIEDKIAGLNAGGMDYITKPFQAQEVMARAKNQIICRRLRLQLKQSHDEMELRVQERTKDLIQANQALGKSEERYRTLVSNLPLGIYRATPDGQYLSVNPSFVEMTGYENESELISISAENIFAKAADREQMLEELNMKGKVTAFETQFMKKDNSLFWVSINSTKVTDPNENFMYIDGVIEDITPKKNAQDEKKKLEIRLNQAQKLEAIGTLAAGIAHDFNNILSIVLGYTELIQLDIEANSDIAEKLEKIMNAGLRARDLVQHILTFSRSTEIKKEVVNIIFLVKETLKFLRASIPSIIEIRQELKISEAFVNANPTQVHQILMNLGTNAAHAMKEKGGIMNICLDIVEIADETIFQYKELKPGRYVRLTVGDTGCGIEKKNINKIFDPFFTTKERGQGTGLGLSVVHGIIKDMKGDISVYSEIGKGAVFNVLVPVKEKKEKKADDLFVNEDLSNKWSGNILFVDDEEEICQSARESLERYGYSVETAGSGLKAIELFKINPEIFDLVLTDMAMPKIDGLELSKTLKKIRPDIPIILCTGFIDPLDKEKIKRAGICKQVIKPLIAREMIAAIDNALNS